MEKTREQLILDELDRVIAVVQESEADFGGVKALYLKYYREYLALSLADDDAAGLALSAAVDFAEMVYHCCGSDDEHDFITRYRYLLPLERHDPTADVFGLIELPETNDGRG